VEGRGIWGTVNRCAAANFKGRGGGVENEYGNGVMGSIECKKNILCIGDSIKGEKPENGGGKGERERGRTYKSHLTLDLFSDAKAQRQAAGKGSHWHKELRRIDAAAPVAVINLRQPKSQTITQKNQETPQWVPRED